MALGIRYNEHNSSNKYHIDQLLAATSWAPDDSRTITWTITKEDAIFSDEYWVTTNPIPYFKHVATQNEIAIINKSFELFNSIIDLNLKYIDERTDGEATIRLSSFDPYAAGANFKHSGWAYGPSLTTEGGDIWVGMYHGYTTYITLHEIGHALGLDHPGQANGGPHAQDITTLQSVMSYIEGQKNVFYDENGKYIDSVIKDNLGIYDIAALQHLYGANTGHNQSNTTYKYDPNCAIYDTIWDGGGEDTIDLSNYRHGAEVNLSEGSYSSINYFVPINEIDHRTYLGQNAIGIAYGAVIENAIGTQGNDVIQGNAASNKLVGGAGNDRLYGHEGNDRLEGGDGDDVLDGGIGADTMIGGNGNDTYYIDSIDDTIHEEFNGGNDTLYVSVDNGNANKYQNIETFIQVEGSASNTISGNALDNRITGNSSDNFIAGHNGDDIIIGGKGNDFLVGGRGSDTFLFKRGDGRDRLTSGDFSTGDIDTIIFQDNITMNQLWFSIDPKSMDLRIQTIGTSDSIVITNYTHYRDDILDRIVDSNGNSINGAGISTLIDAMAKLTPPPLGQIDLSAAYQSVLTPIITAAWTSGSVIAAASAEINDSSNWQTTNLVIDANSHEGAFLHPSSDDIFPKEQIMSSDVTAGMDSIDSIDLEDFLATRLHINNESNEAEAPSPTSGAVDAISLMQLYDGYGNVQNY